MTNIFLRDTCSYSTRVPMSTKLSYGAGGFGKDFGLNVVNTFLFFYYTDVVGISAYTIGLIFLVARLWDMFADMIFAYMVSKTKSRWGKYKPWIMIGTTINCLSIIGLFSAHLFEGNTQITFIALTYILWGTSYTLADAPFWSLMPTITLDKKERERLMPYPRVCASLASYLASGTGIYAVHLLGKGNDGLGYFWFAVISAVLCMFSAIITCRWTQQRFQDSDAETESFSLKKACSLISKNDQLLWLLAIALFFNLASNMTAGLNIYYFSYVLGNGELFSTFMLFAGISGLGSLVFFSRIVEFLGRKTIFSLSLLFPFISAVILYLALKNPSHIEFLISVAGVASGLSSALYWLMVLIMVGDTVDYGDMKLNLRSEAMSYSIHTLIIKIAGAVTGLIIGAALSAIHYIPKGIQTPETIDKLQLIYIAPSLLCIASLFIYFKFYKLNGSKLDYIHDKLSRKFNLN